MPAFPRIALAQINVTVGDIAGNARKILDYYERAKRDGAELAVFPELALIGYIPEDLLHMPAFRKEAMDAAHALAAHTKDGPAMIVGSVWEDEGRLFNTALLLDGGVVAHMQPKTFLPNHGIFSEKRWFDAGSARPITWRGHKLGLLVCEDIWHLEAAVAQKKQGAEILIAINASPFEAGKARARREIVSDAVQKTGLPVVYLNILGGQDDIVFDGGSFVMSAQEAMIAVLPEFQESLQVFSLADSAADAQPAEEWRIWEAMKLGLSDYVEKNHFAGVVLGLSGGIDSALTAACAVDALGAARVRGVMLPSPYTSKASMEDALALAGNLGIETMTVPIAPGMQIFEEVLSPVFHDAGWMEDVSVGGNLQARLRAVALMAISNKTGFMLMSTGNKSEIAVGYSTLYGDSCGGYNVVKDLYKTQLYAMAKWRNAQGAVIPERSITRAPSAELKPNQKDEDQLPPYPKLDEILALHIEHRLSAAEICARGHDEKLVEKILSMVRNAEYKRRQSAPGVKLSSMLFGKDRRYPLTNRSKP